MHMTFYGAVREVTGSMHLLTTDSDRVLLDCGLFQGRRKEAAEKNRVLPIDPALLTNVVLSHAHIDHSGRLPLLTRRDFSGRIVATRVTKDACGYLLPDSAHIQESDANYLNYKTVRKAISQNGGEHGNRRQSDRENAALRKKLKRKHRIDADEIDKLLQRLHLKGVKPLYTAADADAALSAMEGYPFRTPVIIGRGLSVTFYPAGHILGSAISVITDENNGKPLRICYTGDIGRFGKPILKDPCLEFAEEDRAIDLLIMESTYGDRLHEPVVDLKPRLKAILIEAENKGGSILIPSFAYGRTQELLYVLHELYAEEAVPRLPITVDSPLATRLTTVFGEHPEVYDAETHETFLQKGRNPFFFEQVSFTGSVEESIALTRETRPHIVISASGMCEAGRILHHLRYKMHNPNNTILVVGYMAAHTLGRRILEQGQAYAANGRSGAAPLLKVLGKEYPLKAKVHKIDGFSAHADRDEMMRFLERSNLEVKRIALVHGEEAQALAFADTLKTAGYDTTVPRHGESLYVR
ncbi:MAG: MBL fold metallo-hydrolase [Desulfosarcinaceae bacterium]|nr:MBL fold metallo-hydrolase [Desulfosarcinaceae bacterium]